MNERRAVPDRVSVRLAHSLADMHSLLTVANEVWGPPAGDMVSADFLMALAHTGGYAAVAEIPGAETPIGASFGFLARHQGELVLHSHITGVRPDHQHLGIGFILKQHQRSWALEHDLRVITWTFDPLVRRNGWFNLHRLGATADNYFVNFYGPLGDSINGTDETDRLLARWDLTSDRTAAARKNSLAPIEPKPGDRLVSTPEDIIALRHSDPENAQKWRLHLRRELEGAFTHQQIIGLTAAGDFVLRPRANDIVSQ